MKRRLYLLVIITYLSMIAAACQNENSEAPSNLVIEEEPDQASEQDSEQGSDINQALLNALPGMKQTGPDTDGADLNTFYEDEQDIKKYRENHEETVFTESDAIALKEQSFHIFRTYVELGGEQCSQDFDERYTNVEGYYYYCSDLDSEDKLNEYLSSVYTDQAVLNIIKEHPYEIINNKAAYIPGDILVDYAWDQATATIREDRETFKKVKIVVPNSLNEMVTFEVEYLYIDQLGWRIQETSEIKDIEELVVQTVCEQEEIYSANKSSVEIITLLFDEFTKESPFALGEQTSAILIAELGSCFRERTENLVDGDIRLVEQINTLRDLSLAISNDVYMYHEHVEGGGSMYVKEVNSFYGSLELELFFYIKHKSDVEFSADHSEEYQDHLSLIEEKLEEKKAAASENSDALETLNRIEDNVAKLVAALETETLAELQFLQGVSFRILAEI